MPKNKCEICSREDNIEAESLNCPNENCLNHYNEEDEVVDAFFTMNKLPYPQTIYPEANH